MRASLSLVVLVLALTACGSTSTTTTTTAAGKVVVSCHTRFAKTKFALHTGIAAAGFYRYIYNPYRAGAFKSGAPGRKKALAKAAATALVVVHELRIAAQDARCDGAALRRLGDPLTAVLRPLDSLHGLTSGGGLGAIATAQAALSHFSKASSDAGVPVRGG
jgi:hypothetical protein